MNLTDLRRNLVLRFAQLDTERRTWVARWQDCIDYVLPFAGRFLNGASASEVNDGSKTTSKIYNGTATRALNILAAGMQSGLTSPGRPWFRLLLPDPDINEYQPVKAWLSDVENRMRLVFAQTNFYPSTHNCYMELGAFGTNPMLFLDDDRVLRVRPFTVGEYWLSTDSKGVVDGMFRALWMTAKQMVEEFGLEAVSQSVKTAYETGQMETRFEVTHWLGKVPQYKSRWPFPSFYWEKSSDPGKWLRISGFSSWPLVAPRWNVVAQDTYGRSPVMELLGDIKMLQKMEEKHLIALDKQVEPPMIAPASMKNESISTVPGGVTFSDEMSAQTGVRPAYMPAPDTSALRMKVESVINDIRSGLYNDLFLLISNTRDHRMTATEVAQRQEEKMLMLGPVLERLDNELLTPAIDRTFDLMQTHGVLPPPPPEIEGMPLKVEYVSILAQAQKMVGLTTLTGFAGFVGNVAAVTPEVLDLVDTDRMVADYAESSGVNPRLIRDPDEFMAKRQQRMAQQQAAQMAQSAGLAAQGAQTLAETPLDKGSALDAVLGR